MSSFVIVPVAQQRNSAKQFNSVTQSCPTLFDPVDCSTPGLPAHHQLLELTQTHVRWVGDAIQQSHPLSSPSPPAFNLSSIRIFSNESALCIRWPKYWSFSFNISPSNEHPGLISFRRDWLDLPAVQGTLKSLIQRHSSKHTFIHSPCRSSFYLLLTLFYTKWHFKIFLNIEIILCWGIVN